MASLKEIKARINSVESTQKITNAMKMVSAAKLKKVESKTMKFLPYKNKLYEALTNYLGSLEEKVSIPLAEKRIVKKVILMAFSSNSGLCGVYNSNISRLLQEAYNEYGQSIGKDNIIVYAVGKKINEFADKYGIHVEKSFNKMSDKPTFEDACEISDTFVKMFLDGNVDKVEMIYNHYKNTGVQVPQRDTVLPLSTQNLGTSRARTLTYIVEPSKDEFVNELVPKVIRTNIFSIMLDANTAEHAARTTAMHIASDNANELSQDLKLEYNKARQEVITDELIDIVGGAEALKKK